MLLTLKSITQKRNKRLGRGPGSGKGMHTVGRGTKGMGARKSGSVPQWYEGGQLPLIKRMPMTRGKGRLEVLTPSAELSLTALDKMQAEVITLETLKLEQIIDARYKKAKVIGNGKLTRSVTLRGVGATQSARKAIEAAGGKIE